MSQPDLLAELRDAAAGGAGRAPRARPADRARRRSRRPRTALRPGAAPSSSPSRSPRRLAGAALLIPGGTTHAPSRPCRLRQRLRRPDLGEPAHRRKAASRRPAAPPRARRAPPHELRRPSRRTASARPRTERDRVQRYSASLELRVATPRPSRTRRSRPSRIARSSAGSRRALDVDDLRYAAGDARPLVLRIPKAARPAGGRAPLGARDDHRRERLDPGSHSRRSTRPPASSRRLKADAGRAGRRMPQTTETEKHIAALTAQIARLQRGRSGDRPRREPRDRQPRAQTRRRRRVAAPTTHGPLHGLGVAFRWAGIGAVYALALGAPLVALAARLARGRIVRAAATTSCSRPAPPSRRRRSSSRAPRASRRS